MLAGSFVQDIVAADDRAVRIGKECVGVTPLARVLAVDFGRVYADRQGADSERFKLAEVLLDTP